MPIEEIDRLLGSGTYNSVWWFRGEPMPNGPIRIDGLGYVTLVDKKIEGELVSVVFRVVSDTVDGVTGFYKKTGYESSYGDTDMDGPLVRVYPKQKTITTYEEDLL